jgi:hypothetical protein
MVGARIKFSKSLGSSNFVPVEQFCPPLYSEHLLTAPGTVSGRRRSLSGREDLYLVGEDLRHELWPEKGMTCDIKFWPMKFRSAWGCSTFIVAYCEISHCHRYILLNSVISHRFGSFRFSWRHHKPPNRLGIMSDSVTERKLTRLDLHDFLDLVCRNLLTKEQAAGACVLLAECPLHTEEDLEDLRRRFDIPYMFLPPHSP